MSAFCVVNIYSQGKTSVKPKTTVFSSVYLDTDTGKSCRTLEQELIGCQPVGGYRLFVGFHNVIEALWIENARGEEVARIPSDKHPQISRNIGKIEWRLANGKPFAVIARFVFYTMEDVEAGRDLSGDRSKFPQLLIVKGLTGFEDIDFDVDVKTTPNSNRRARELADAAYAKRK